jgi:hypothetical protein
MLAGPATGLILLRQITVISLQDDPIGHRKTSGQRQAWAGPIKLWPHRVGG